MAVLRAGNVSAESNAFEGGAPTILRQLETAFHADDDAFAVVKNGLPFCLQLSGEGLQRALGLVVQKVPSFQSGNGIQ